MEQQQPSEEQLMELEALESLFPHHNEYNRLGPATFSLRLLPFPDASAVLLDAQLPPPPSSFSSGSKENNTTTTTTNSSSNSDNNNYNTASSSAVPGPGEEVRSIAELKRLTAAAQSATEGEEVNFVAVRFVVSFPPTYPECLPDWKIDGTVGLDKEQMEELEEVIVAVLQPLIGCSMIFSFADAVQEWLREHNKPELSMHDQMILRAQRGGKSSGGGGAVGGGSGDVAAVDDDDDENDSSYRDGEEDSEDDDEDDDEEEDDESDGDEDDDDNDNDGKDQSRRRQKRGVLRQRKGRRASGGCGDVAAIDDDDDDVSTGGLTSKVLCPVERRVTEEEFVAFATALRREMIQSGVWKGSADFATGPNAALTGRQIFEREALKFGGSGLAAAAEGSDAAAAAEEGRGVFWRDEDLFDVDVEDSE